ncbi:hypothetical protein [Paenibacillus rubinfantis]|uniref:hypothetical protein n=1 Tax=Paenibacillus rubinfantis TaxID=1720296 RepID=UPI00073F8D98|nr:hypothetical protein [Paenibacillus rubinfantis]
MVRWVGRFRNHREGGILIRKGVWISATAGLVLLAAIYTWWYIENVSPVKLTKTVEGIAWMEEDPAFTSPVRISFDGYYDKGDDQFRGTVEINGRVYSELFLENGYPTTHFEGSDIRHYGQVYFDGDIERLVWFVPQSQLTPELTNPQFPEAEVCLVTPASSREEASNLRQELADRQ